MAARGQDGRRLNNRMAGGKLHGDVPDRVRDAQGAKQSGRARIER